MTVTIEPGADLRDIQQRVGVGPDEELRESEKRRRYLQGFARLITPVRPTLRLTGQIPTAMVNQGMDDPTQPAIFLTTNRFDQPATDYSQRVFDLIMQEALTVHEIGHILYTDHRDFKQYADRVDAGRKKMFQRVWNTLEDAAIEEQLRREYDVSGEVQIMNANLFEGDEIGHVVSEGDTDEADPALGDEGPVQEIRFSFFQAVCLGLMDMGVYDSGKFAQLRDAENDHIRLAEDADRDSLEAFVSEMKAVVRDVKTEPKSRRRNERIYEFWQELEDQLDSASNSGERQQALENLLGGDGSISANRDDADESGDESGGEDTNAAPMQGKPDDTGNDVPGDARDAYELGMSLTEDSVDQQVEMGSGDADDEGMDGDASDRLRPDEMQDGDDGQSGGQQGQQAGDQQGQQGAGGDGQPDECPECGGDLESADGDGDGAECADCGAEFDADEMGEMQAGGGDVEGEGDTSDGDAEGADGDEADADSEGDGEGGDGQAFDADMEEMYQQELAAEASELGGGEALLNEIEQFLEIIEDSDQLAREANDGRGGEAGAPGFEGLSLEVPESNGYDREKWATVQRRGRRIARILRDRLSQNQQNRPERHKRSGKFDRRSMIRAERGSPRVFMREQDDEKKDYDAIFVLDRSGSMSGDDIEYAELALGELAYAFQLLGINVCVMDLHTSQARLAHAFGQDMEQTRGVLFSGDTAGGTPLAQVLHLARKRVLAEDSNPFMVVVTDGQPADPEAYREELESCTFPVLGVCIGSSSGRRQADDESYFHRQVFVEDRDEIDNAMVGLATEVIDAALVDLSEGVSF